MFVKSEHTVFMLVSLLFKAEKLYALKYIDLSLCIQISLSASLVLTLCVCFRIHHLFALREEA